MRNTVRHIPGGIFLWNPFDFIVVSCHFFFGILLHRAQNLCRIRNFFAAHIDFYLAIGTEKEFAHALYGIVLELFQLFYILLPLYIDGFLFGERNIFSVAQKASNQQIKIKLQIFNDLNGTI